ncbi:MAG: phnH [Betaproteobacteria bacterium]|nr:phnH [Betaproteobacteria bacterium]
MTAQSLDSAFATQAAFRAVMECFARPGEIRTLDGVAAPAPLASATAALIQSLADYETPIWLDPSLAGVPAVGEWIRFQTGAALVKEARDAAFALIGNPHNLPEFAQFALGTEEYPDRSTTLIMQVERFAGHAITIEGPGTKATRKLAAEPLPDDFANRMAANRELFPRGIDLVLVAGEQAMALPRSIRVSLEA